MKDFRKLYETARAAGMDAAAKCTPQPMTVVNEFNPRERYYVSEGVCGFAWVSFKGNTAFGRWAKQNGASKNYPTGLCFWVSDFGQSMQRKEAYASAFAGVLREAGVPAYSNSRLD